jgi:hypothetical protein
MRDVLQSPRARRTYGEDRSNGATIVYADPANPSSGRVWQKALQPHRSPCRIDAGKGLSQHRCSASHADMVCGYRAWRDSEYAAAEDATGAYATELADYWRDRPRPTLGAYLTGLARTDDR